MKIVFIDADGTLFHSDGFVPKSAIEACRTAQKKGYLICLCTGRQRVELYGDMLKIDYDALICGAGAHIEIDTTTIIEKTFTKKQMDTLQNYFETYSIPVVYETSNGIYCIQDTMDILLEMRNVQCDHLSKEDYERHGLVNMIDTLEIVDSIKGLNVNKISFLESERPYKMIHNDLHDLFHVVPATFAPLGPESGEIASYQITKGTGILDVIQHMNINIHDTISIGDNYNDLPMFETTAHSIAMGNAPVDIKKDVDYVTTSIDEDGIKNAFDYLYRTDW